jgi:methyl-accepting chemotaxis protein
MRLLTKSEVDQAKARDRNREVQEGIKLARKVDDLRALLPQEEAALEKWRTETIAAIQAELKPAQEELATTLAAVKVARNELEELRKPLDEEWEQCRKTSDEVEKMHAETKEVLAQARNDAQTAVMELDLARIARKSAEDMQQAARDTLTDASERQKEAKTTLEEARKVKKNTDERASVINAQLDTRAQHIAEREKQLILWEDRLTLEQTDINTERKQLADQRKTLERAFNRLKK